MMKSADTEAGEARPSDAAIDAIIDALEGLRDGQLEVQLHDARVVRIMRAENIRLYDESSPTLQDDSAR